MGLGRIAPTSTLADDVFPLIGRRADKKDIAKALRRHITGRVIVETLLDSLGVICHVQLAGGQISLFFAALHNLIRNREGSVIRVVAVLQRGRHELDFVLVARDLRQEAPTRADNDNVDRAELLNRRVRQLCHCSHRVLGVALVIECHEVVQAFDLVAALRETRSANHHLLSRRNNFGI